MTPREQQLLSFIKSYQEENDGVSPSFDEMTAALGLVSRSGIHRLLDGLCEQGRLARTPYRARRLTIIPQVEDLSSIPDAAIIAEYHKRTGFRHSVASAAVEV